MRGQKRGSMFSNRHRAGCTLTGNQKMLWSWKAAMEECWNLKRLFAQFRPWRKRTSNMFHHLTYSPEWNGSSCFFSFMLFIYLFYSATQWNKMAQAGQVPVRPWCTEERRNVWNRHCRRVLPCNHWCWESATELSPFHLSWINVHFFFLWQ